MVERMEEAAHGATGVREAEEVKETAEFLSGCATGTSSCSAPARTVEDGPSGPAVQVQEGSGLGILRGDGESRFAQPTP